MPIDEEIGFYLDRDSKIPSQMSATNLSNRYSMKNKFSKIDNQNISVDLTNLYRSYENSQIKTDSILMNNSLSSLSMLEQEMNNFCNLSSGGSLDDYRIRLANDELMGIAQKRNQTMFRSASNGSSDTLTFSDMTYVGINRGLSDPTVQGQWNNDLIDENKVRDYCALEAKKMGFIVGDELEIVKAKSHRSVIQNTPDRIINTFKDRYGQSDSSSKKTYLQLGVRVPSKEHVSEIVGKQGSKIKQIREKTGALITTPGEQEDHVFIIEAPPRTALHVAQILKNRAEDITTSRNQENRRRSSCPINNNNRPANKSPASAGINQTGSKIILSSGRIQVPKIIVGRIIGTQGSIITTIQRDTGTEIRSPPKEIGKPKNSMADFEILVYQTSNFNDLHEAKQRVLNAKQLIAHVAMHQLEKIRAEEAPYSNYQVQSSTSHLLSSSCDQSSDDDSYGINVQSKSDQNGSRHSLVIGNRDKLLSDQMKPHEWIWCDVDKLEDNLAQEVVNRILEESKKKTKTRSEPSIYDENTKGIFTMGETDSFSNIESVRPRHSLPETKASTQLESFYKPEPQSSLPFSNENYFITESESDFHSSPNISFINRDINSRQDMGESDIVNFQSQDFVDNYSYNGSDFLNGFYPNNQMSLTRDIGEQKLIQQLYFSGFDVSGSVNSPLVREPSNRMYNRYLTEQNIRNATNYSKSDSVSNQQQNSFNNNYFPFDNSHWSFIPPGFQINNSKMNSTNNNNSKCSILNGTMKSYADSVKPLIHDFQTTTHGTIGDHLKKGSSNNNFKP